MSRTAERSMHTPGPWERRVDITGSVIRIEGRERPDEQRRIVGYATTFSMAEIAASQHGNDGGKAYANARLIAAAPDLLEACKAAVDAWRNPADGDVYEHGEVPAIDALRAAIAKAEGRAVP